MATVGFVDTVGTEAVTTGGTDAPHLGDGESTLTAMLLTEHPMTFWGVAARLGDSHGERAWSAIEELTAAGKLARSDGILCIAAGRPDRLRTQPGDRDRRLGHRPCLEKPAQVGEAIAVTPASSTG